MEGHLAQNRHFPFLTSWEAPNYILQLVMWAHFGDFKYFFHYFNDFLFRKHFQYFKTNLEITNFAIYGGSHLMRISLLRFFKTFHKYLPYANLGLFISLVQIFGQKIAKVHSFVKLFIQYNTYLAFNALNVLTFLKQE